jgi:hypothetical protein
VSTNAPTVADDVATVRRALASIPDRPALLAFERIVKLLKRELDDTKRTEVPR